MSASLTSGAGCLGGLEFGTDDGNGADTTDETDEGSSDRTSLERWVPTSGSTELLFHYRDLATVRQHEDVLQPSVTESIPTVPDGDSGAFVEQLADGEPAVDSVCRFGSEGVVGNVVVSGSFDPDAVNAALESVAGDFERFERDGVSVAVSAETLVVSPSDGAALEAILAAGVEGTDRRAETNEGFGQLVDRLEESTFLWGEYDGDADGNGAAFSWALGSETTMQSMVSVYADPEQTDEFEDGMSDRFDDVTVETDGTVGVATRTLPTTDYEYRDMFAELGSESTRPQAGVTIDTDPSARTVTITYISSGDADRLEIRDWTGLRDELTEVGQDATLEYDAGASGTITIVAVRGETEAVVAEKSVTF